MNWPAGKRRLARCSKKTSYGTTPGAGVVRAERDAHLVVDVAPLGMVIGLLGGERHLGHEGKGAVEVLEHEFALDGVAARIPRPICRSRKFRRHGVLRTPLRI